MCEYSMKICGLGILALALLAGCRSVSSPKDLPIPPSADTETPRVLPASFIDPVPVGPELETPEEELAVPPLPVVEGESSDTFQLSQLEEAATLNNPALAQIEAQLEALHGKWFQAGLPPNPTLGYTAGDIGEAGGAGKHGAFVGQTFIRGNKLGLDQAIVSQEVAAAEQKLVARRERVLTDVRLAYYDALLAQRRVEVATELVANSREAVTTSEKLFKAKDIPQVGLLQTQVQLQTNEIVLRQAQNGISAAWRRLSSVIGQPDLQRRKLTGDLDAATSDYRWEKQLQRLTSESPEIAEAVAEMERARWALSRACAETIPDVDMQISVQGDTLTGDTLTGIQFGMPLRVWNKNQGGIHQAQGEVVSAERNLVRVELALRNRLAEVFRRYADAQYQANMFAREMVPKAKRSFDLVQRGYMLGEVGYLDLLAANRTYYQTRQSQIDALQELWQARLLIDGMLLDDSLSDGEAE